MKFIQKYIIITLLIIILLIATGLRVWQLTEFPPSATGDEATNGLEVIHLLVDPHITVFFPANTGREALFFYLLTLPFVILGPTLFALRIVPALMGILLVALSYRWVKLLLPLSIHNRWIALVTALFIATSPWGLYNSRVGLRGALLPLFMLAAYIFYWNGYRGRQVKWFVLSGVFLGLSAYTYTASRLLPLTFIAFALSLTLFYRNRETTRSLLAWQGLIITGLVILIVAAPLGWYFVNHPDAFWFRSSQLFLLTDYNHQIVSTDNTFFDNLLLSWEKHLRFFIELSTPWVQNQQWPLVLRWLPLLFWLGLFRAIYLARRQVAYAFLVISFLVGMLPIIFTFPTTLRNSPALPQTYALLAIGAYFLIERLQSMRANLHGPITIIAVLALLLISVASAVNLFQFENWIVGLPDTPAEGRWVHMAHLPTVTDQVTDMAAQRIKSLVLDDKQSVLVPQALYDREIIKFELASDFIISASVSDKERLLSSESISMIWSPLFDDAPKKFLLLSPSAINRVGVLEIFGEWRTEELSALQEIIHNPQAVSEIIFDARGQPAGFFMIVDREQLMRSLQVVAELP